MVDGDGYFNTVSDRVRIGDTIYVVVVTNLNLSNEAISTYGPHLVSANAAGVVDVNDVTIFVVTDTD